MWNTNSRICWDSCTNIRDPTGTSIWKSSSRMSKLDVNFEWIIIYHIMSVFIFSSLCQFSQMPGLWNYNSVRFWQYYAILVFSVFLQQKRYDVEKVLRKSPNRIQYGSFPFRCEKSPGLLPMLIMGTILNQLFEFNRNKESFQLYFYHFFICLLVQICLSISTITLKSQNHIVVSISMLVLLKMETNEFTTWSCRH